MGEPAANSKHVRQEACEAARSEGGIVQCLTSAQLLLLLIGDALNR